jgi:hypothetical protein
VPTHPRPARPNPRQAGAAPDAVDRVAVALRSHNIEAIVVDTGQEAREVVLGLIPDGAEVHSGKSKTLEEVGLYHELMESGRYDAIRPRIFKMDRQTEGRQIRKLTAAPDFMLGSVAAVTEAGTLVAASATGSQLAGYATGAGRLILVVGAQKIVPDPGNSRLVVTAGGVYRVYSEGVPASVVAA